MTLLGFFNFFTAQHPFWFTTEVYLDIQKTSVFNGAKLLRLGRYFSPKQKQITKKPLAKGTQPMFVQFVLEPLWKVPALFLRSEQLILRRVNDFCSRTCSHDERDIIEQRRKQCKQHNTCGSLNDSQLFLKISS